MEVMHAPRSCAFARKKNLIRIAWDSHLFLFFLLYYINFLKKNKRSKHIEKTQQIFQLYLTVDF